MKSLLVEGFSISDIEEVELFKPDDCLDLGCYFKRNRESRRSVLPIFQYLLLCGCCV